MHERGTPVWTYFELIGKRLLNITRWQVSIISVGDSMT